MLPSRTGSVGQLDQLLDVLLVLLDEDAPFNRIHLSFEELTATEVHTQRPFPRNVQTFLLAVGLESLSSLKLAHRLNVIHMCEHSNGFRLDKQSRGTGKAVNVVTLQDGSELVEPVPRTCSLSREVELKFVTDAPRGFDVGGSPLFHTKVGVLHVTA